jgi:hypothetical protein
VNRIEVVLRAATTDLTELRLRWALVGGLAVSARTEPRFTRDIDLVIARSDTDAEQAVHALRLRGYRILILFASSGIEAEVASIADTMEILPGLRVPVATVGHLLALSCCLATIARGRRIKWIWWDSCELRGRTISKERTMLCH